MRRSAAIRPLTASDGELAKAIASAPAGTAQAEEAELYRRFAGRVRLYGLKHLRDAAAADDLAQEVLLVTLERLRAGEVRNPDEIGSFILGTSRMLADSTERKTRRREHLTALFHAPELYAEPDVASGDIAAVERCLHGLSERDRRVLVLTFYAEKTSGEIAEELGVTGTVVRVARHRALERLRECVRGQVGLRGGREAMTVTRCPAPIGFTDVVDYWAGDLTQADEDRIEEHVFTCAECARELAAAEALARGIAAVAREGRLHAVVNDAILNRLAADGVRVRMYTLEGAGIVPCAVWADDDLVVARIRADFAEVDSVTIVTRQASGDEISRLSDVAVRPGQREILSAFSAAHLRKLPPTRVRVTVTAQIGTGERTISEYTLEHAGAFDRLADAR